MLAAVSELVSRFRGEPLKSLYHRSGLLYLSAKRWSRQDIDDDTRVDLPGYLILDYAGQDFLEALVELHRERYPDGKQ